MSDLHPSPVARLLAKPAVYGAVAMLWLTATVVIFWTSIPGLSRIQQARAIACTEFAAWLCVAAAVAIRARRRPATPWEVHVINWPAGVGHLPEPFRTIAHSANEAGRQGMPIADIDCGIDVDAARKGEFRAVVKIRYRRAGGAS